MRDEQPMHQEHGGATEYDMAAERQGGVPGEGQAPRAAAQPPPEGHGQPGVVPEGSSEAGGMQQPGYGQEGPGAQPAAEQQGGHGQQGFEQQQGGAAPQPGHEQGAQGQQPGHDQHGGEHAGHGQQGGAGSGMAAVQGERPGESHVTSTPLLDPHDAQGFERRWEEVQVSFVDQPQQALHQADALVDEVMQRITRRFSDERGGLESQWSQGGEVSTEDLRVALQHYRSFFNRLLSVQEGH